jgi:hypothetical protein
MPNWLSNWKERIALAERSRRERMRDKRFRAAFFCVFSIVLACCGFSKSSFADGRGSLSLAWLTLFLGSILLIITIYLWSRFISTILSWVVGIIAWAFFARSQWLRH